MEGHDEVGNDQHDAHDQEDAGHDVRDRQQLGDVDVAGVGTADAAGRRRGAGAS